LHRDEILNACEGETQFDAKALVNAAKDNYEKEMKRNCIPRFVLNTGETYPNDSNCLEMDSWLELMAIQVRLKFWNRDDDFLYGACCK